MPLTPIGGGGGGGIAIGQVITGSEPNGILYADADGNLQNNANFTVDDFQNVSVNGNITVGNNSFFLSDLDVSGALHVHGESTLDGDVNASADFIVGGSLQVASSSDIEADLVVGGDMTVSGTLESPSLYWKINTDGSAFFGSSGGGNYGLSIDANGDGVHMDNGAIFTNGSGDFTVGGVMSANGFSGFFAGLTNLYVSAQTTLDGGTITTDGSGTLTLPFLASTTIQNSNSFSTDNNDIYSDGSGDWFVLSLSASAFLSADVNGQFTGHTGTSGGIPYFNSTTTLASSALLANNQLVTGAGAGAAPRTLGSLGTTTTVLHGNASGAPSFGPVSLTADVSNTLPVGNGGTGVSSVSVTPVISGWAGWDANKNMRANNSLSALTSTATAAGTTVLTVGSTYYQVFTGATTQTITLPVATTLINGQSFMFLNQSLGTITIQTSGGTTLKTIVTGASASATCVNTAGGTGTASWF